MYPLDGACKWILFTNSLTADITATCDQYTIILIYFRFRYCQCFVPDSKLFLTFP